MLESPVGATDVRTIVRTVTLLVVIDIPLVVLILEVPVDVMTVVLALRFCRAATLYVLEKVVSSATVDFLPLTVNPKQFVSGLSGVEFVHDF